MLTLQRFSGLFGRDTQRKVKPSIVQRSNRARVGLERLETRDSPSALSFLSPSAVYGAAALNGSGTAAMRSLLAFNSGDIAHKVGSGLQHSESYASLGDYSGASSYK